MRAPRGLAPAGRALWGSVMAVYTDFSPAEIELLVQACRQADLVSRLQDEVDALPSLESAPKLVAELRASRLALTRVIAALRLPSEAAAPRPQNRDGVRGVYQPRKVS